LDAGRVLPVVSALEPAFLHIRRWQGRQNGEAEVRIARRAQFRQLDDAVAVGIGPGAGIGARARERSTGDGAAERVELTREADGLARDIPAQARLQRRPAVAGQVVGDADARAEIPPARKIRLFVEMPRRNEGAGREILLLELRVQVIETKAE